MTTKELACRPEAAGTITPAVPPRVDLLENDERVVLLADLPGVAPEGLEVTLEKDVLTIRGDVAPRAPEGYEPAPGTHRPNRAERYERSFRLANDLDHDTIDAELADGVLRLSIERQRTKRTIDVRTS